MNRPASPRDNAPRSAYVKTELKKRNHHIWLGCRDVRVSVVFLAESPYKTKHQAEIKECRGTRLCVISRFECRDSKDSMNRTCSKGVCVSTEI